MSDGYTYDKTNTIGNSTAAAPAPKKRLGDILVESGFITQELLAEALVESKSKSVPIGSLLVQKRLITINQLKEALHSQQGFDSVDSDQLKLDIKLLSILPDDFIKANKVIPISSDGKTLIVGMITPSDKKTLNEIVYLTGQRPRPLLITHGEYQNCIETYFNVSKRETTEIIKKIERAAEDLEVEDSLWEQVEKELQSSRGDVAKFTNKIITDAIDNAASDIHIEPRLVDYVVRYRIDGILKQVLIIPNKVESSVITRFKVLARMNIAEHRRSQDGTFTLKYKGASYDFRINTLPVGSREKMVIRVLAPAASIKSEDKDIKLVGATAEDLEKIKRMTATPNGIILATGPTGSGKTTTLYSILKAVNDEKINITTIEDPIEIKIDGVNQSQVNPKAGITFATSMRAILRQDPDVILVGEIRDQETLEVAISAALTGHLVLSTIHTNSAAGTIARLIEMGAKNYLISSALAGIVAQRLVRKLCEHCKEKYKPTLDEAALIIADQDDMRQFMSLNIYKSKGCKHCDFNGYDGRLAIYEVLIMTKEIKKLVSQGFYDLEIEEAAIASGMKTLQQSALGHILDGTSTVDEFLRVLGPVNE